jgi:hypothetical protein
MSVNIEIIDREFLDMKNFLEKVGLEIIALERINGETLYTIRRKPD